MCHDELFSYDILGQASGEVTCKVDWSRSNGFSWVWLWRSSLAHVVWFRRWVRGWGTRNIFIGHYYSWCHPRPHPLGPLEKGKVTISWISTHTSVNKVENNQILFLFWLDYIVVGRLERWQILVLNVSILVYTHKTWHNHKITIQ